MRNSEQELLTLPWHSQKIPGWELGYQVYLRIHLFSLSEVPSYMIEVIILSCMEVLYKLGGETVSNGAI